MPNDLLKAIDRAVEGLGEWLTDNTDKVFEEQPEIDEIRTALHEAAEKHRAITPSDLHQTMLAALRAAQLGLNTCRNTSVNHETFRHTYDIAAVVDKTIKLAESLPAPMPPLGERARKAIELVEQLARMPTPTDGVDDEEKASEIMADLDDNTLCGDATTLYDTIVAARALIAAEDLKAELTARDAPSTPSIDLLKRAAEYVERFADEADEPSEGDCRKLLVQLRHIMTPMQAIERGLRIDDVDQACLLIQDALGITDGGCCGMHINPVSWARRGDRWQLVMGWLRDELSSIEGPE